MQGDALREVDKGLGPHRFAHCHGEDQRRRALRLPPGHARSHRCRSPCQSARRTPPLELPAVKLKTRCPPDAGYILTVSRLQISYADCSGQQAGCSELRNCILPPQPDLRSLAAHSYTDSTIQRVVSGTPNLRKSSNHRLRYSSLSNGAFLASSML